MYREKFIMNANNYTDKGHTPLPTKNYRDESKQNSIATRQRTKAAQSLCRSESTPLNKMSSMRI